MRPLDDLWPDDYAMWELIPLVDAVIEAADKAMDQWDTPERYIGTQMADLRAALTALDVAFTKSVRSDLEPKA